MKLSLSFAMCLYDYHFQPRRRKWSNQSMIFWNVMRMNGFRSRFSLMQASTYFDLVVRNDILLERCQGRCCQEPRELFRLYRKASKQREVENRNPTASTDFPRGMFFRRHQCDIYATWRSMTQPFWSVKTTSWCPWIRNVRQFLSNNFGGTKLSLELNYNYLVLVDWVGT